MLVSTVLAPHRAEHRPLERVGLAADHLAHQGSLVFGEACVLRDLVRLRRFRRPQDRGRAHVRGFAPRGAIKGQSSGLAPRLLLDVLAAARPAIRKERTHHQDELTLVVC
jgi:hypothetical protein